MESNPRPKPGKPLNVMPCPGFLHRSKEHSQRFIALRFASSPHLCYYDYGMSALIFTGDLQEVLPGELAVRGELGSQCAVCETCKGLICKVLR